MIDRFTDNARSVIRAGFRRQPAAAERDILAALAGQRLAGRLLQAAGIAATDLPSDTPQVEQSVLVAGAVDEARRLGLNYVGSEHVLLALARRSESALAGCGVTAERLAELLPAIEVKRRQTHLLLARRLGRWFGAALRWMRGRAEPGAAPGPASPPKS